MLLQCALLPAGACYRLRMMAVPYGSGSGRTAASNYQTLQPLAGGGAALVQWKLETGRTHQIRCAAAAAAAAAAAFLALS
jgi:23S rRNA-/tRNA-specific pseudouridylate synthase